MISDPVEFELFKNALFGIADEMALTVFRTTYSGVLKDNMDYSTALFDGAGVLVAQGLTLPGHLGSMPTAMASVQDDVRRQHPSGRRLRLQRPVPRRDAPARRVRVEADFRRRDADRLGRYRLPPHRCRRPGAGVERIGFDRDLPGGAAHPTVEALRPRGAQRDPFRADRDQCAGAGQGVRRPPRAARRLPYRRAGDDRSVKEIRRAAHANT